MTCVHQTGYDDLPREAIDRAKRAIIDTVGTTLAGATEPVGDILTRYVTGFGKGVCTSIGAHLSACNSTLHPYAAASAAGACLRRRPSSQARITVS